MYSVYCIFQAFYNMIYVYIDTQDLQVTETQAKLQERVNVGTKWAVRQCATLRALLEASANGDFLHIIQYVDFAVPDSAGNTVTYRLNTTSGTFNMKNIQGVQSITLQFYYI
jgi:hypothetical protein